MTISLHYISLNNMTSLESGLFYKAQITVIYIKFILWLLVKDQVPGATYLPWALTSAIKVY